MPIVKVSLVKGKTKEYKKILLECIHEGLMQGFGIVDEDRFQRIEEYDACDFEMAPEKTDHFMIIEITAFPGRTKQQKEKAIKAITNQIVERLQIAPRDVFIIFYEPPLENWGMAGNQKG